MTLTITEVKRANKSAGRFWFSPETVKYLKSRVESTVFADRFWIESVQNTLDGQVIEPREYSIAEFDTDTGDISWVSVDYNRVKFTNVKDARAWLLEHLATQGIV
jgi:hypothetical protein